MGFQWALGYAATIHSGSSWIRNLKEAWWVQENQKRSMFDSFELLCRVFLWGSSPTPKMSSTLSRARKEQKAGSSPNRVAALMLLCQELRPLRRRPGPQKALHLGARCVRTSTWATADLSGARQRLGVWSWKGDRFITENRIRSPRAGVPIDKGSLLFTSLSS